MIKKWLFTVLVFAFILGVSPFAAAASPDDSCRLMLINKVHMLDRDYAPSSLTPLSDHMRAGGKVTMTAEAAAAAGRMARAMAAAGLTDIYGQSGYRSYDTQKTLNNRKINNYRSLGYGGEQATELACTVVAAPGASEHQSGLAIDFTTSANGGTLTGDFAKSPVGQWLAANSWKYGFVLRYPPGKENITGYIYEPWHFRYVGEVHAEYMYKKDLCLEEYYTLLAKERVITYTAENQTPYAIYYSVYNNGANLGGGLISMSRAYADSELNFVIVASIPDIDLFDIVGNWAEQYIRALEELEIAGGYPNNTFRPEKNITRSELVILISRVYDLLCFYGDVDGLDKEEEAYIEQVLLSGVSPFADVPANAYYLEPLLKLNAVGLLGPDMLVAGTGGLPRFLPDQTVLRREAAQSLAPLFAERTDIVFSGWIPNDMLTADPDLQADVQVLVDAGILTGNNYGNFQPDNTISRAEVSAMLFRILIFFEEELTKYPR